MSSNTDTGAGEEETLLSASHAPTAAALAPAIAPEQRDPGALAADQIEPVMPSDAISACRYIQLVMFHSSLET